MENNEHLRQTLDFVKQQIQRKAEEIRLLQGTALSLETLLGEPHTDSAEPSPAEGFTTIGGEFFPAATSRSGDIRPDEFFGMSQSDAAKAYLKRIGRAVSLDQLVDGLRKGGAEVGGVNPKKTLYVSLMRNPLKEFVVPSENHIGLRAFYPSLPKVVKPNWSGSHKPKAKKQKPKKVAANKTKTKKENNPVTTTVRHILSFGPKSRKELLPIVREKLLQEIPEVRLTGALRSKEFKEVDGRFQLAD
jgi:hypothetical protein